MGGGACKEGHRTIKSQKDQQNSLETEFVLVSIEEMFRLPISD